MREYVHTQTTKRILIVDDEPDITFVFKIGLEDNGFVVDTFNDPQLAISNFKPDLYDLLLIDIGITKMNDFEFYREIRKINDKVKACFFTASDAYYMDLVKNIRYHILIVLLQNQLQ